MCAKVEWGLIMSGIIGLVVAVYGGSVVVAAGAGVAWALSRRFRRSLIGDHAHS